MTQTHETQFIIENTVITRSDTLLDLQRYKELKTQEANLTAELDRLKAKLLNGWFCKYDSFVNENGLEIATAKIQKSVLFNQTEFKHEHPALYEQYKTKEVITQPLRLTKYF